MAIMSSEAHRLDTKELGFDCTRVEPIFRNCMCQLGWGEGRFSRNGLAMCVACLRLAGVKRKTRDWEMADTF